MIARLLVSIGVVAASVGFIFLGISTSTYEVHKDSQNAAYILMGGGILAAIIGWIWDRANERSHQ